MDKTSAQQPNKVIVTIGRQYGSGGRALGRLIAERLGIGYFDKELLSRAAADSGISEDYMTVHDERSPSMVAVSSSPSMSMPGLSWYQLPGAFGADSAYKGQADTIRKIADEQSCVIVGRTADYVLRNHPRMVSVFVHAPEEHCARRIMSRTDITSPKKALDAVNKTNRLRAKFYNFYTEKQWGNATSYDLCIDTSKMPLASIADFVVSYIKMRFPDVNFDNLK